MHRRDRDNPPRREEPDDDEHIQLQLHLQFEDLLNDRNRTGRQGCLVLEPICQNPLRDPYTLKTLDSSRAPWVCHPGWIPSRGYHNFPYVGIDNRQGIGSGNRVGITERGDSSLGLDFTKVRGAHTVDLGFMRITLGSSVASNFLLAASWFSTHASM